MKLFETMNYRRISAVVLVYFVKCQVCLQSADAAENTQKGYISVAASTHKNVGNCSSNAGCDAILLRGECHHQTGECVCRGRHPVKVGNTCINGAKLSSKCIYTEQCQHFESNSVCAESSEDLSVCVCREGYSKEQSPVSADHVCHVSLTEFHAEEVATLAGLGIGLSLLSIFICFTLKLFSKARNVEARGYADASLPPTIMVEGKDVSHEVETCSRTSSKSRIYTPGPPLTPSQVRRMSELSCLSVTVQEKDFKMRPVSPGAAVAGYNSGPGSLDMLFEEDESVEQQLTIIPRPESFSRRKSLVNHAFPELHRKTSNASNSLVILTRTKTDSQGRRHSVAVPLLAAPPKTDSGLVIERKSRADTYGGPGHMGGRRHSLQVGTGARPRRHGSQPGSGGRSPRRTGSRRQSSRRPSRQGFYQFLEQAVAF